MKKHLRHISFLGIFVFLLPHCDAPKNKNLATEWWESPVDFDFQDIKERGFIRAVVDNSSTSYYIYRGRTMGYEYELLQNLAKRLDVDLSIIISSELNESFRFLNEGKADIIAINFEFSEERKQYAAFTDPIQELKTVLVQRTREDLIHHPAELDQKKVHVKRGTIYTEKLLELKNTHQVEIFVEEVNESLESLITKVRSGEIDYTVVDDDVALVNATYYDDIDVSFGLGEPSQVGWAVRKNSPELTDKINEWISRINHSGFKAILYDKYFLNKKNSYFRNTSAFSSLSGSRISVFDEIIKEGADLLGWDWRLLAALIYKESRFDTSATSYAGAVGLLQLMPVTLQRFGVENPNDPNESLRGGVNYLKYLDHYWTEKVPDINERIKFILASYNVGHGHVHDSWRLALRFGKDTRQWSNVAYYLEKKSQPEIYKDPLVKSGYAKGHVAVSYVREVISLYESYKVLVDP